jgi:hypothetical protein
MGHHAPLLTQEQVDHQQANADPSRNDLGQQRQEVGGSERW